MSVAGREVNGLRIAKARAALQNAGRPMTQAAFAQRIGIHWVTMSNIENGKAKVSLELLERICEETGESRSYFLGDDEEEEAAPVALPVDLFADAVNQLREAAATAGRDAALEAMNARDGLVPRERV